MISEDLLRTEFEKALPDWVEKNFIVKVFRNVVSHSITIMLNNYSEDSNFLYSDKAKEFKQEDYSLHEYDQSLFKDKYKILFLRGSLNVADELKRLLRANIFMLFEDTELYENTPLDPSTLRIILPNVVNSGFIMDFTYPSINNVSFEDYAGITTLQDLINYFGQDNTDMIPPQAFNGLDESILSSNDYVFSETVFILIQYKNKSDFSEEQVRRIIRRELFPAMPVIIENII